MSSLTETDRATSHAYVDVAAVRRSPSAPCAETTVIRLLGLLPSHWSCVPEVQPGRVRLRVLLAGTGGVTAVRRAVSAVLDDPALRGWHPEE
ncbi:hypothetical protein [Streptomyces sp. JJ36]|uniref:hypothetical protein n=1 Tax=Streptomyces sp. JJ36 TaxID=2736645 RepID=UPI001F24668F|nr:hypothetical protein [Streptomyces sp. JJ36]MCF6526619.1 hypothetical protein [Streptomyces sp. JJ36]